MDIQNNSIVTDADTEVLDSQITQISNDFAETYYLDNEQEEELELLIAKAMKLGELYERKKWQAAKAQAVPEGFVLMPIKPTETMVMAVVKEHEGDAFLPYSLYDTYVKQAMIEAQEQGHE
ncbi:hypothetical protein [Acinetobacter radioresistens]|uniref:hypothetical protein n=1 Tax=Acinetobacter radioresistens TaxID=40216 RepID=UPI00157B8DBD|nr:hypothetical protein [Acinetobacter radioresistens]NTY97551.1 hypothetical protein [Acinetobacter radioresistens]